MYTIFIDPRKRRGEDVRRCLTAQALPTRGKEKAELALRILGPDQDATEFLTREKFEEVVTAVRREMGWDLVDKTATDSEAT